MRMLVGAIIGLIVLSAIGAGMYPNNNYDLWLILFPIGGAVGGAAIAR